MVAHQGHPRTRLTAKGAARAGPGKHCDGEGLYLVVDRSGARRWVLRVAVAGRRREIGLGPFPMIGLARARDRAGAARRRLGRGIPDESLPALQGEQQPRHVWDVSGPRIARALRQSGEMISAAAGSERHAIMAGSLCAP